MKKKILSLMLLVLLFSLTLSQAFGETYHYHHLRLEWLSINIEAPDEAKVNEEFNVKLTIYPYSKIYVDSLNVSFSYYGITIYEETLLYQKDIEKDFSKTYSLKTKIYDRVPCIIDISYVVNKGTSFERRYFKEFRLDLTYVNDKTRRELENDYNNLSANYNWLKRDYENIERDYNSLNEELQGQKEMTAIFLLTTMIFLASTIYFAWKIRRR